MRPEPTFYTTPQVAKAGYGCKVTNVAKIEIFCLTG